MASLVKSVRNLAILGVFVVGIVVSAGSFGFFGCQCTYPSYNVPDEPAVKISDLPSKGGDMPPLASPK